MSNPDYWMKKWGFDSKSKWYFWRIFVHGTWYLVQLRDSCADSNGTSEGTLYIVLGTSPACRRQVQILDTFFNVERWTLIEEWRRGDSSYDQNGTSEDTCLPAAGGVHSTLYIVLPVINYFHKTPFFFYPNKLQFCSQRTWYGCITSTPETSPSRQIFPA